MPNINGDTPEQGSGETRGWGSTEAGTLFAHLTAVHISSGIHSAYLSAVEAYVATLDDIPGEALRVRSAAMSELPIGVIRSGEVADEASGAIGHELFLAKVNPLNGEIIEDSDSCWLANILFNGEAIAKNDEAFTADQLELLLGQYRLQEALGLTPRS